MENLVVIFGPTAVGKTGFATKLAYHLNGEIVSADSRQVYKYLDIGTGKDLSEFSVNGQKVKHHLIDIAEPTEEYDLYRFITDYNFSLSQIYSRNKLPFLVGGTSLFLHSIFNNYQLVKADFHNERFAQLNKLTENELKEKLISLKNDLHNKTDLTDKKRIIKAIIIAESNPNDIVQPIPTNKISICILPEKKVIHQRINFRLKYRLENGMIEEVENLLEKGITYAKLDYFGLEYRYLSKYLLGDLSYNDMFQKLDKAIREFAKKQITWIRKFEREGIQFHVLEEPNLEKGIEIIEKGLIRD